MKIPRITLGLISLFSFYNTANAAALPISDVLSVTTPTGVVTQTLYESATGQDVNAAGNPTNYLQISVNSANSQSLGVHIVALSEPTVPGPAAAISDLVIYYTTPSVVLNNIVITQAKQNWVLISDKDGVAYNTVTSFFQASAPTILTTLLGSLINNSSPVIAETGQPQDVTALLGSPYTVTVTSDVEAVPVPAAAWLFGSSLIGLTGLSRKRKAA